MTGNFQGRVWPNGEFGIGRVNRYSPDPLPRRCFTHTTPPPYSYTLSEASSISEYCDWRGGLFPGWEAIAPGYLAAAYEEIQATPLGSSNSTNSPRAARGSKGITSYGRKMIRNGAWLLGRRCHKKGLAMLTTTLPALPYEDYVRAVNSWSEIMRQYLKWLSRRLKAGGGCGWIVGCCEIQEERMMREGGLPLHAHLLFDAGRPGKWRVDKAEFRSKWQEIVCRVAGIDSLTTWDASTRVEVVRKNAESYISKYASKGCNTAVLGNRDTNFDLPKTWWYGFGGFKKYIKKMIKTVSGEAANKVKEWMFTAPGLFRWARTFEVDLTNTSVPVGWYGQLNALGMDAVRVLC